MLLSILLFGIVCSLCSAQTGIILQVLRQQMNQVRMDCERESSVIREYVDRHYNGEIINDRNLQCFVRCVMYRLGYMTYNGDVQFDYAQRYLFGNQPYNPIRQCIINYPDPCYKAYIFDRCISNQPYQGYQQNQQNYPQTYPQSYPQTYQG